MASFDQRIVNRIKAKAERAERHIYDLQAEWDTFKKSHAYKVTHEDDAKIGQRIYRLSDAWEIPHKIPLIAGDAIHNFRCALDHIAYQMVFVCTGGVGPFSRVYFPIGRDLDDFRLKLEETSVHKSKSRGIVKRLRPEAIKAIEAVEAYEGGCNAILWHLHCLDITDKHHLLITAGSLNRFHSMTPSKIADLKKRFLGMKDTTLTPARDAHSFLSESTSAPFPLKAGDEIYRVPLSEVDENIYFPIDVAFVEPKIVKGKAILDTLRMCSDTVNMIIRDFALDGLIG